MEPFRCRGVLFSRNIEGFRHKTAGALPHIFFVEGSGNNKFATFADQDV